MRITLFKTIKYSLLASKLCLCVLVFSSAISASINAEAITSPTESETLAGSNKQQQSINQRLDWVIKEHMNPEQQALVAKFCCGAYIEPDRTYQDADKHPDESALRVNAISTEAQSDTVAILEGDVNIAQGYRQIKSNSALVDQENRRITLIGNVRFREPNMLLMGNHALLDLDSEEVQIESATYVLHQSSIRGSAKSLRRKSDGIITIKDSSFTSCEPSVDSWKLQTSEINLDQTSGFATVKNARLDLGKVPVFYFPYAKFPITERRSSGLLFPSISNDQENGIDFSQPIYWNIAPNYDATITPRYIQHRGMGVEAKFRHLSSWSKNQLTAGFLGNDKGGNHDYQPEAGSGLYPYQDQDRYMFRLKHQGNFATSWTSHIDFNKVSDEYYFSDIGQMTEEEDNPTHLRRVGSLGYQTDSWQFAIEAQNYQSITLGINDPYEIASRMTLNGNFRYANSVTVSLKNQQTEFKHDSQGYINGRRTLLDYRLGMDNRWSWGYFKPSIGIKHLNYQLDTQVNQPDATGLTNSPTVTVPTFSLDSGIIFEKESHSLSKYTQTLEPRFFYVKSNYRQQDFLPDFDTKEITSSYTQLFRENRFAGGDRISDDHRLSLGLSTSLIDKKNGHETLRASIAQAIYFDDRKVTLTDSLKSRPDLLRKKSDLALEVFYRINDHWRLNNQIVYNNQDQHWENGSASLYYQNKETIFNISYHYSRLESELQDASAIQPIEQADLSFYIPTGNDFSWVGRWHHDFTNNRELEVFSGFEYNNCCWRAGLVFRRWLDRSNDSFMPQQEAKLRNGVFLQIQFKGIAGAGGRLASILKKGIYGYEPVENF